MKSNFCMIKTLVVGFLISCFSALLYAQTDYPNRPVKVIVPFGTGSVPEGVLRIFTNDFAKRFGQAFIIEHKPGASTNIAAAYVAQAAPDGYTLLLSNLASNALNKWTYKKLSYDPDAFATIGLMGTSAFYIVVRPESPFKSVSDLVNTANKSSESLKYGSLGTGGAAHLVTELFGRKLESRNFYMSHIRRVRLWT